MRQQRRVTDSEKASGGAEKFTRPDDPFAFAVVPEHCATPLEAALEMVQDECWTAVHEKPLLEIVEAKPVSTPAVGSRSNEGDAR